jgi:hypothetical protein
LEKKKRDGETSNNKLLTFENEQEETTAKSKTENISLLI